MCRVTAQYWQGFSAVGEESEPPVATEDGFFGCYEDLVVMNLVTPNYNDEFERIMSNGLAGISLGMRFSVCDEILSHTPGSIAELYPRIAVPLTPEIPLLVERTAIAAELE